MPWPLPFLAFRETCIIRPISWFSDIITKTSASPPQTLDSLIHSSSLRYAKTTNPPAWHLICNVWPSAEGIRDGVSSISIRSWIIFYVLRSTRFVKRIAALMCSSQCATSARQKRVCDCPSHKIFPRHGRTQFHILFVLPTCPTGSLSVTQSCGADPMRHEFVLELV